jgi:ribosomal protein L34
VELTRNLDRIIIKNMSITLIPKKRKRKKVHGFLKRKKGKVLKRRRKKGRWRLCP